MVRSQAQSRMRKYLKSHFIKYREDLDEGTVRYTMLLKGCDRSPDRILESCIWFCEDGMEVRTYYSKSGADWCRESGHIGELMRLLNYINARVWPCTADGMGGELYRPHYLYTPRICMTEDGCYDITMTFLVNYDFYETAPLETEDFITAVCPDLMDALSPAVFGLLLGQINLEEAAAYVREKVIGE